jgi:hypothetical protein
VSRKLYSSTIISICVPVSICSWYKHSNPDLLGQRLVSLGAAVLQALSDLGGSKLSSQFGPGS